jgi:hypothetical protein
MTHLTARKVVSKYLTLIFNNYLEKKTQHRELGMNIGSHYHNVFQEE